MRTRNHDHLVFLGGASRETLGERTGNLLFTFFACLYMWRVRHSQLLSATRTQFWLYLTFIADTWLDSWLVLRFVFKSPSCGWTSDLEGSYNADL